MLGYTRGVPVTAHALTGHMRTYKASKQILQMRKVNFSHREVVILENRKIIMSDMLTFVQ